MNPETAQIRQTSPGPTGARAKGVRGDALAWTIDDDRLAGAALRIAFLRWSCPIPTPSGGGHAPTADRSSEPHRSHFTLAPDYRSLSKDVLAIFGNLLQQRLVVDGIVGGERRTMVGAVLAKE